MKRILPLFAFLFCSALAFGQDAATQTEVEKTKPKPPQKEFILININFDGWLNTPSTIQSTWFASRGVDIAVLYDYVLGKSNFSLAAGVGFNSHNVKMDAFPTELTTSEGKSYTQLDPTFFDGKTIVTNKISTNFIDIPIEFRFRSNPNKSGKRVSVAAGFKLGWLVQSHTKTRTDEDFIYNGVNFRNKIKTYDIPNLRKFRYGVTARAGFARFYVNFFYSLTPLFVDGRGTDATPISIGIGYSPY
ncbi:MAG: PorT family protein [Flavobacteriales bacterium]|nr:PorT family protein [Flavobacteriales bacterium]